jgi:hypothetical protein
MGKKNIKERNLVKRKTENDRVNEGDAETSHTGNSRETEPHETTRESSPLPDVFIL